MQGKNKQDAHVNTALQILKKEMQQVQAPTQMQVALMQAFDQAYQRPSWWRRLWTPEVWITSAVMAACLLAIVLVQPVMQEGAPVSVQVLAEQDHEEIPFIALRSGETLLKQEQLRVVQADVPNSVLANMGVAVSPQTAGSFSRTEMLVNERDEYLAVRFIPSD